ncbi:MAG: (deoxy)nucleoside triphosphate pyrophosphohydrolase [Lachnospiraceae bacterium]|nr:(deoxy)nucleoside triphosphate pyrophosphohydrolase [Lachnospiraceae bacterium]
MKTIRVAAAIICDDMEEPTKIFATAKGYGEFKGQWEFPGGKIEEGESAQEALVREIREELDTEIEVGAMIHTIEYDYPAFHLSMDCFLAKVKAGSLTLKEAQASRWLTRSELYEVQWLPADISLIEILENILK